MNHSFEFLHGDIDQGMVACETASFGLVCQVIPVIPKLA